MTTTPGLVRIYGLCVVLMGCLYFAVHGYRGEVVVVQSRDFKTVYAGAGCLIDACDPYDPAQIQGAFSRRGGDLSDPSPFIPFNANYPPSALFLLVPFALLPFGPAHLLWMAMGTVLFCVAAFTMIGLCAGPRASITYTVLAAFVATSTVLIMLGQPALPAIGLVVIAAACFLKGRYTKLAVVAFALSLTLKPQLGAFIWLFFFLAERGDRTQTAASLKATPGTVPAFRRLALQTLVATLILMTPGILLAFHHHASARWPQEFHENLAGIAAPGNLSDPGPTNGDAANITDFQTLFSLIHNDPSFYNKASFAAFLPLFMIWVYLMQRPMKLPYAPFAADSKLTRTEARGLMGLAGAAALTFLPIYHRQYDTRLLLLIFPAFALLISAGGWKAFAASVLSLLAVVTLFHQSIRIEEQYSAEISLWPGWIRLFVQRPMPFTLLALSCFFLYCMLSMHSERGSLRDS